MSTAYYMPLMVNDYLGKTRHLTTEQHGAYLLLLMTMWNAGGYISDDDTKLARVTGMSKKKWLCNRDTILEFMQRDGGSIYHPKLLELRQKVASQSDLRRAAGAKGGAAKALKDNNLTLASATALPKQSKSEPNIPPIPPTGKGVNAIEVKAIWDMASPLGKKRSGISKTKVELQKLVRSGIDLQTIERAIRAYYADCDKTGLGHMGLHLFIRDRSASWIEVMEREKPKIVAVDRVATARALLAERRVEGRWREQWTVDTGMTEQDAERLVA
jgi:uncharacterized protein YdaU (DUF1376 family)